MKVDCWSSLCQLAITPAPQDQQRQSPFHVKIDCWSSLCQLSITPRINRGNCLFMWKLTVDPLYVNCWSPQDKQRQLPFHAKVDCWSSLCQLSITPRINRDNCLFMWKLTVDPLYVNCWSPPGSTEVMTFLCQNWLLILSMSIIIGPPPDHLACFHPPSMFTTYGILCAGKSL